MIRHYAHCNATLAACVLLAANAGAQGLQSGSPHGSRQPAQQQQKQQQKQKQQQTQQQQPAGQSAAGGGIYGGNLMTVEERNRYRTEIAGLGSDAERQAYQARHRERMELRAKERGTPAQVTQD
jgi:hypothetical protein